MRDKAQLRPDAALLREVHPHLDVIPVSHCLDAAHQPHQRIIDRRRLNVPIRDNGPQLTLGDSGSPMAPVVLPHDQVALRLRWRPRPTSTEYTSSHRLRIGQDRDDTMVGKGPDGDSAAVFTRQPPAPAR